MNYNSLILDSDVDAHVFLSNAFYGEKSAGTWTMKLIAAKSGCNTTWNNWQLNVIGH
jgi:subtilisin-like proprotein convertase family protein